ncbi:hypothetical protein OSTOST_02062, partial [Ostertagia ostertagi]
MSRTAAFYGVAFQICDVLKPVTDENIINHCRDQMLEDEEKRFALTTSAKKETVEKNNEAPLGQAGFGIEEGPYSARVYDGMQQRKKFKIPKGRPSSLPVLERNVLVTPPLMLCVRTDRDKTEAWSVELGVTLVEETYVKQTGKRLKKGDWFYGSVRCCDTGSKKFYYVKKVHSLADPLGYTYWLNNSLEIELEVRGSVVENLPNGKALMQNPHVGKIEIAQKDYNRISSERVVAILRFNKFNPNVPWTFVRSISVLAPNEELPILSPDCLLSYHMRRSSQAHQGMSRDQIRRRESCEFG